MSKRIECCNAVEEAEAQALLAGLRALSPLYRGPIIAETDCAFVANELRPGASNCSAWHSMFTDIKEEIDHRPCLAYFSSMCGVQHEYICILEAKDIVKALQERE